MGVEMKKSSKSKAGVGRASKDPVYSSEENLERLGRTRMLESFVNDNGGSWDHQKWIALCDKIREKEFMPIDFDHIGLVLEGMKSKCPMAE